MALAAGETEARPPQPPSPPPPTPSPFDRCEIYEQDMLSLLIDDQERGISACPEGTATALQCTARHPPPPPPPSMSSFRSPDASRHSALSFNSVDVVGLALREPN